MSLLMDQSINLDFGFVAYDVGALNQFFKKKILESHLFRLINGKAVNHM